MLMRTILTPSEQSSSKKNRNSDTKSLPAKAKSVLRILIKTQQIESPRYENVQMDNEVSLGKIHFDWNPVSVNRVVRFLRFYKYTEDVVEAEKIKLKQSFKIHLVNLHKTD